MVGFVDDLTNKEPGMERDCVQQKSEDRGGHDIDGSLQTFSPLESQVDVPPPPIPLPTMKRVKCHICNNFEGRPSEVK